jgi:hypothetical protein
MTFKDSIGIGFVNLSCKSIYSVDFIKSCSDGFLVLTPTCSMSKNLEKATPPPKKRMEK